MTGFRDFNFFYAEALDRNRRAAEVVRRYHEEQPFESRKEIQEAFEDELGRLERSALTAEDRVYLASLGIGEE